MGADISKFRVKAVWKSDRGDASNTLRHREQALHPGAALEQRPPPEAHAGNVIIDAWSTVGNRPCESPGGGS